MTKVFFVNNGQVYKTKSEAGEGATVKYVECSNTYGTYNPRRVAKLKAKLAEKRMTGEATA